jgi:uncharacterized protein (DUF433 family)
LGWANIYIEAEFHVSVPSNRSEPNVPQRGDDHGSRIKATGYAGCMAREEEQRLVPTEVPGQDSEKPPWLESGYDWTSIMTRTGGFDRITVEVGKMNGQPCIRGLRLTVRRVLEALATYDSREELLADYPELEEEDIRQALAYAAAMLADETVEVPSMS